MHLTYYLQCATNTPSSHCAALPHCHLFMKVCLALDTAVALSWLSSPHCKLTLKLVRFPFRLAYSPIQITIGEEVVSTLLL